MKRLVGLVIAAGLGLTGMVPAQASTFGCSDLATVRDFPAVEGRDGVFFRVHPDMHNFFPFADETVDRVGELSEALAATGTRLVFLPVPTKALAMPAFLPIEAEDFGHDPDLAATVYDDIIRRLERRGVAAANLRRPMVQGQTGAPGHFQTDHRWTAAGARAAATAVAARLGALPELSALPRGGFTTAGGGSVTLASQMFAQLQQHCQLTLPPVTTVRYDAARAAGGAAPGSNAIFGATAMGQARIAVVGTEYTGEAATNFAGFLAEQTGFEVVNYHVPGGGGFAAISSYLTSDAYQTARPAVLVWEVPVEVNLGRSGDQPMRELIAAAGNTCRVPLNLFSTGQPNRISVDLNALDAGLDYTLFVDSGGAESPEATFEFRSRDGFTRARSVLRHPDQQQTGRFAMPMSGLWADGAASVEIELTTAFGGNPRVVACFYSGKG